ncbi:hypothetical protein SAMN05216319_1013 [Duganella sp. CF402]|uniref:hypothetical protein n=1 Tax=unclassified Duganella TaxID=2636909 RepID=UPI0008C390CA|nr:MULTISPECIES: hypothetical protein [unclassified Duganella]RZT10530.1 hypothetical protein EV582_2614 [Duganella sp. BK701]SEL09469.1 hypothetical protein SAMN05216319_1013 [Duganella sp. CF402]
MIIASADSTWANVFDLPIHQRYGPAPDEALRHIRQVNAGRMWTDTRAAVPDDALLMRIQLALAELPQAVIARLQDSFLGVYFANGVGSSAVTDIVVSQRSEFLGLIIVLDLEALDHADANAWASWRERSPFDYSAAMTLDMRIADDYDDDLLHAIRFLLLHELGHALSAGRNFLPDWWSGLPDGRAASDYSYLPISWQIDEKRRIVPLPGNDFPLRASVSHYDGDPRLPAGYMADIYRALKRTSFPTLYSAANVHEDFAESLACYVHMVLLQRPLSVRIYQHGELLLNWQMDWRSERYASKLAFFERLLGGPA